MNVNGLRLAVGNWQLAIGDGNGDGSGDGNGSGDGGGGGGIVGRQGGGSAVQ